MKAGKDDNKIISLFLKRDEDAIRLTRELYGSRLRSIAFRVCGDERTAEECENDTYLEAWNRIPPHEPGGYLFPFLAKIVRSKALNRVKQEDAGKRRTEIVYSQLIAILFTNAISALLTWILIRKWYNILELISFYFYPKDLF